MRILLKLPTRSRPDKALMALRQACSRAHSSGAKLHYSLHVQVNVDYDDETATDAWIAQVMDMRNIKGDSIPVQVVKGFSGSKINAVNRDMEEAPEFDILVLLSDDMICQVNGWDDIIRAEMADHFPTFDGVIWHSDGYTNERLNTMVIIGSAYYARFGYIYNPAYQSLWCDNEFMEVANILQKQQYFEQVLFKHEHPVNIGERQDALYCINDKFYHADRETYELRKKYNFGL